MANKLGLNAKIARTPTWNPVGTMIEDTWIEPVEMASKDRLLLPIEARKCLRWPVAEGYFSLLATLGPEGGVELIPWFPLGREALRRVEEALASEPEESRHEIAVAAMDRYYRVALAPDGRLRLPRALVAHLGANEGQFVRVVATRGKLVLWPERLWVEARQSRFRRLDRQLSVKRPVYDADATRTAA